MIKKKTPTISQSEVKVLKKKAVGFDLLPSNSIYFGRYPYKIVFNLKFDPNKKYGEQILNFKFDLTNFTEEVLKHPTRQLISTEKPSLFIQDYKDLILTLAVYKDSIHQVCGPISKEHLELLFSNNYRCQGKDRLWYGIYDCKIETWLPFKYRRSFPAMGTFRHHSEEDAEEINSLIVFIKENLNAHIPKHWTARFTTTIYCKFDEFVNILPFLKLSYPKHTMMITRAILNS